jgi:hypothetical protein
MVLVSGHNYRLKKIKNSFLFSRFRRNHDLSSLLFRSFDITGSFYIKHLQIFKSEIRKENRTNKQLSFSSCLTNQIQHDYRNYFLDSLFNASRTKYFLSTCEVSLYLLSKLAYNVPSISFINSPLNQKVNILNLHASLARNNSFNDISIVTIQAGEEVLHGARTVYSNPVYTLSAYSSIIDYRGSNMSCYNQAVSFPQNNSVTSFLNNFQTEVIRMDSSLPVNSFKAMDSIVRVENQEKMKKLNSEIKHHAGTPTLIFVRESAKLYSFFF